MRASLHLCTQSSRTAHLYHSIDGDGWRGDLPFVACVTSDRDISALERWCSSVCTHMRTPRVGECSWRMGVPNLTISDVSPVPERFGRDCLCKRRRFAPRRVVRALLWTGCTAPWEGGGGGSKFPSADILGSLLQLLVAVLCSHLATT